jgi:hypothetical protein
MKIKYLHFKSKEDQQHSVVSVGYVITPNFMDVQVARCRAPDIWCRWKSHRIIEGRFKKKGFVKRYTLDVLNHLSVVEVLEADFHPDFGNEVVK